MGGSLSEAVWLYRHNFDYVGLFQQKSSIYGGPKFFLFSLYPGLMALLMKISAAPKTFIIMSHLLNFFLSSIIVALFRKILKRIFNPTAAVLSSILLLSLPLYQTMTEIINMEILCLFFSMLCLISLAEKKISKASVFAILAVCVKGSGSIACATTFAVSIITFFPPFKNAKKQRTLNLFFGTLAMLSAFAQVYLRKKFIHVVDAGHNDVRFLIGLKNITDSHFLPLFLGISLLGMLVLFFQRSRLNKSSVKPNTILIPEQALFTAVVFFIFVIFWNLLHVNVSVMGPRYKLLLCPPLLFGVIFTAVVLMRKELIVSIALIAAIMISYLSSFGLLYPYRIPSKYYNYCALERSLEYRNDLFLYQRTARELENNFQGYAVGAPHVFAQAMAFREFGYFKNPPQVIMYAMSITFGGIQNFQGLGEINIHKTIWIGYRKTYQFKTNYPLHANDKIIKEVIWGDKKATLFMGGFAIDTMYRDILLNKMMLQMKKKNNL